MVEENKLARCFIALELSREAITEIEEIQSLLKKKNLFYGKFTESENLHLTLKFLGAIDEGKIEEVKKKLADIKLKSFEVNLGELGFFSKKSLRILWIKLQGEVIWQLQKEIDRVCFDLGFKKEERFMSHITLVRIKKVSSRSEFLRYVKNLKHRPIRFFVKDFFLKKSELFPEGPVYSNTEKYSLE